MGSWLSRDAESVFFQRLNRRVLGSTGASWAYVDPLISAMRSEQFVEQQVGAMRHALACDRHLPFRAVGIPRFFGRDRWEVVRSGGSLQWGWKDPRTTVTFPIWLRLFPQARWVHIVRNGIDVAISTHRRSKRQRRRLKSRVFRGDYSPITLDFDYCFRLWEKYVLFVLEYRRLIPPDRFLVIRYEDLLGDPVNQLQGLMDFLQYRATGAELASACRRIDHSRLDNSDYAAPYRDRIAALVSSPLMQQLDYSYDTAAAL
jgi:hypothetical protein